MELKECKSCRELKPLDSFGNPPSRRHTNGHPYCKPCMNSYARKWRANNKVKAQEKDRRTNFKRRYGITVEDYTQMLEQQGGACAVCGTDTLGTRTKHFSVDHCHDTSKVRGLLCDKCNRGLGMLGDTLEAVLKAADYLRRNG